MRTCQRVDNHIYNRTQLQNVCYPSFVTFQPMCGRLLHLGSCRQMMYVSL